MENVTFGEINFTKNKTPPWVFFTFLKLLKWYQMAQRTTSVVFQSSAKLLRSTTEYSFFHILQALICKTKNNIKRKF